MLKVDFTFNSGREPEKPLDPQFVASRPLAGPRSEHASGAPAAEDRPLHLDPAMGEPQPRRPGTTYQGFSGDPAAVGPTRTPRPVRRPQSQRGLLAVGLAAVVGLGVAGALWSYTVLERRAIEGGGMSAEPAPLASSASGAAQVAAVDPLAEVQAATIPAPLDAATTAPSPALREELLAELAPTPAPTPEPTSERAPDVARPERQEPRKVQRPTSAGPEASAATARANLAAAYAPESTLSAQLAAQAQPAGD